jgi:heme A synthase
LLIGTWRSSSCSRDAKRWAVVAAGFIFVEAGIGAALVLFELVKENASGFRAVMIAVHLANSFGLIGALALCWWSMTFPERIVGFTKKGLLSVCAMLLVGMAGAITALGDTLFPAMTHSDSMSLSSPFLVQLRIIHPLLAVLLGVWLLIRAFELGSENGQERLWKRTTLVLLFVQYGVGILSVALKVPVCLQLIHLLLADLLWVSVLFCEQLIFLESSLKNTKSTDPIIYRGQYL